MAGTAAAGLPVGEQKPKEKPRQLTPGDFQQLTQTKICSLVKAANELPEDYDKLTKQELSTVYNIMNQNRELGIDDCHKLEKQTEKRSELKRRQFTSLLYEFAAESAHDQNPPTAGILAVILLSKMVATGDFEVEGLVVLDDPKVQSRLPRELVSLDVNDEESWKLLDAASIPGASEELKQDFSDRLEEWKELRRACTATKAMTVREAITGRFERAGVMGDYHV